MAESRSSAVAGIERAPGESLYRKLVAEGRITEEVAAERRRQYPGDKDKWDCSPAEASLIRVDRDAGAARIAVRGADEGAGS
jgi:hypothetical protein